MKSNASKKLSTLLISAACVFTLMVSFSQAQASRNNEAWKGPTMLSEDVQAYFPDIVADNYGQVHAVWTEKRGDICTYDTVVYSVYQQGQWEAPKDILVSPTTPFCANETAIAYSAKDSRLYVTWTNYVMYISSAPVERAADARAWSRPVIVDNSSDFRPKIVVDDTGRVHLAYFRERPYWELQYSYSDDQGHSWSNPVVLQKAPENHVSDRVNMTTDARGRVHIAWTEYLLDQVTGRGGTVYYIRSTDRGQTWEMPIVIDKKDERFQILYAAGEINVVAFGDSSVMLAWAGPPEGHRWYKWSSDGGATWSTPNLVVPENVYGGIGLRNFNEGMPLAVDSNGRVHLISSGSRHLTHLVWVNGVWSGLDTMLNYEPLWPRMTIASGNQLFFIGAFTKTGGQIPQDEVRIWSMQAETNAAYIAPQPTPTTGSNAQQTPENAPMPITQATPTQLVRDQTPLPTFNTSPIPPESDIALPVVLGVSSVIVLVLIIVIARIRKSR